MSQKDHDSIDEEWDSLEAGLRDVERKQDDESSEKLERLEPVESTGTGDSLDLDIDFGDPDEDRQGSGSKTETSEMPTAADDEELEMLEPLPVEERTNVERLEPEPEETDASMERLAPLPRTNVGNSGLERLDPIDDETEEGIGTLADELFHLMEKKGTGTQRPPKPGRRKEVFKLERQHGDDGSPIEHIKPLPDDFVGPLNQDPETIWVKSENKRVAEPLLRQIEKRIPVLSWIFVREDGNLRAIPPAVSIGLPLLALLLICGSLAILLNRKMEADSSLAENEPVTLVTVESDQLEEIRETLKGYLEAKTIEEKLPFVRASGQVKPKMERYFRSHKFNPVTDFNIEPGDFTPLRFFNRDFHLVKVKGLDNPEIILERDEEGLKIDWEMHVDYQANDWNQFTSRRSSTPTDFKVIISSPASDTWKNARRMADFEVKSRIDEIFGGNEKGELRSRDPRDFKMPELYWNFDFSDPEIYDCWILRNPSEPEGYLYGYTKDGSEIAKKVEQIFVDRIPLGNTKGRVTLKLAYPKNARDPIQVEIVDVVNPYWLVDDYEKLAAK